MHFFCKLHLSSFNSCFRSTMIFVWFEMSWWKRIRSFLHWEDHHYSFCSYDISGMNSTGLLSPVWSLGESVSAHWVLSALTHHLYTLYRATMWDKQVQGQVLGLTDTHRYGDNKLKTKGKALGDNLAAAVTYSTMRSIEMLHSLIKSSLWNEKLGTLSCCEVNCISPRYFHISETVRADKWRFEQSSKLTF